MTINISIAGHAEGKEQERAMLGAFRDAVMQAESDGEVYSASASTTHHATVDLKQDLPTEQ